MSRDIWAWYDAILLLLLFLFVCLFVCLFVMLLTIFFQVVQATFRFEEITNSYYQQLDNVRRRHVADVQSFNFVDQINADLRKKLTDEEKARKSADSALESAERQVEDQRQRFREANDQLASSKEQIAALRKKLEKPQKLKDRAEKLRAEAEKAKIEAEKARNETEQHGYDVGIAKTENALRAKVPVVYQTYCTQTWEEAPNRARVKASSKLRRLENIYFPPPIPASNLPSTQGEVASMVADPIEEALPQDPLPPNQQEQPKEPKVLKDTSLNKATKVPQDGVAFQGFEQALASTIMLAEGTLIEKEKKIPTEADKPANKNSKDKLQIKLKH